MRSVPVSRFRSCRAGLRRFQRRWLCLVVFAAPLRAQSLADRAMLAAWDDSVQQIASAGQLDQLATASRKVPGKAGDLRRALFLIRRGELGGTRADVELALTAATVVRNHTRWGWARFVQARGFTVMSRKEWIETASDGMKPGEKYGEAIWRSLREALDLDQDLRPARDLLISLTLPGGDRTLRDDQIAVFARLVARPHPDAGVLLIWARHLRTHRAFDSALAYLDRANTAGADPSVIALERARTLRATGDTAGAAQSYWAGVQQLTPAGRELYRFDLAWIISGDSLASFNALPDSAVPAWLHRFWNERDATAANVPGERLLAHLMRWIVADTRYRVMAPWRYTPFDRVELGFDGLPDSGCTGSDSPFYELLARLPPVHPGDIRQREPLLDHRGLIYLRHGAPLRIIGDDANSKDAAKPSIHSRPDEAFGRDVDGPRMWHAAMLGVSMRHNESWLYLIDGQLRLLHFRGSSALGMYGPTTLTGYLPLSGAWYSRGILPVYANAAAAMISNDRSWQPLDCLAEVRFAIAQSRTDARESTRTDTDSPPILHPWRSIVRAFALGDDHSGKALITFALGGQAFHADTLADGRFSYPVRLRIVAYNPATDATVTRDSTRTFIRATPIPTGSWLTAWEELPLDAGRWQLAVRARQDDDSAGVYAVLGDVQVNTGTTLSLSDVVTGIAGASPWIASDGGAFPVNYLNGWYSGETAELFYEVRGLHPGTNYNTTVEVRPIDPKARAAIQIQSSGVASGEVTYIRKALVLDRLAPGQYWLTVTVAAGDLHAVRRRILSILEKK
jgi:hypothetical protein